MIYITTKEFTPYPGYKGSYPERTVVTQCSYDSFIFPDGRAWSSLISAGVVCIPEEMKDEPIEVILLYAQL